MKRLGIYTARDLLYHFPSRYADAAETFAGEMHTGATITLIGTIEKINKRRTNGKRRIMITEASIQSEGKKVRAVWFHQPYIANQYTIGDTVTLSGKIAGTAKKTYITNPIIKQSTDGDTLFAQNDKKNEEKQTETRNELIAVYPETHGVSSLWLSTSIEKLLGKEGIKKMEDPIPEDMRNHLKLPDIYNALIYIHKPRTENEHIGAKKRFVFEKTLTMQITQQRTRNERLESKAYKLSVNKKDTDTFMKERFEFTPTQDQKKAIKEILTDIHSNKPMARLLEGDVGSGKTAVAAAVMHGVVTAKAEEKTSGRPQVAYLAPTEVLARQQFNTLMKLFNHLPINIGLISGKECLKYPSKTNSEEATDISKTQLKKWIASGEIAIVVGTHAVIQKDIKFQRLALVIIDEQHRFGVAQRQSLINLTETHIPHLLSMTATPIPRTLALTIYGDLDISVIEEVPKGRKAVSTKLVNSYNKDAVYNSIRKETEKGHQAYVLCPRIEESDDSILRSVTKECEELKKTVFPDLTVNMLHGKMKPKEKKEIMEQYINGTIQVLVCTTVVEVGVNVPNATIIAILHAERFGLAQLHQLRGRVIRSSHQPHCYAITDSKNELTLERLKEFEKVHNGFNLAQKDLDMRGSGELAGLRQSGVPDLVMEGLKNQKLVAIAQQEAKKIVDTDPELTNYPELKHAIETDQSHNE